jgi:hypothetical protein
MDKIWLVTTREYLARVRSTSFVVATILVPVLLIAGVGIASLQSGKLNLSSHLALLIENKALLIHNTLCCPKPARVKRGAERARHVQRLNASLDLYDKGHHHINSARLGVLVG